MKDKLKDKEIIRNVLRDRIVREQKKIGSRHMPYSYLLGYKTAIEDCYWDLFGEVMQPIDECFVCNKLTYTILGEYVCQPVCKDCYPKWIASEKELLKSIETKNSGGMDAK